MAAAAMPLVADDRRSSTDTASLAPAEWKRPGSLLSAHLNLLEIFIMPSLYWRQNPIISGDFVKTLSTVQIITTPKACTIKMS